MIKKGLALTISLLMVGSILAGCGSAASTTTAGGTIKLGVILPMTGAVSTYGVSANNGIKLATDAINAKGGINGKKVELDLFDDEAKTDKSVTGIKKLIDNDKVVAVIGSVTSGCTEAIGSTATAKKIPLLTPTATAVEVTSIGGAYVYRSCFLDSMQGNSMSVFAIGDLKAKNAAILYDNSDDYSKGLTDVFAAGFGKTGNVKKYSYNAGDKDYSAQLTQIKAQKPDVVYLPEYYGPVADILKQAQAMDIKATFLGVDGWDSPKLVEVAGTAANNNYFSNHYTPEDTAPAVVDFVTTYKKAYNVTPDALAALGYDAANIMFDAIKNANSTDGAKIKDALQATNGTYVCGKVSFDKDRNPVKDLEIVEILDGKQKAFKKVQAGK